MTLLSRPGVAARKATQDDPTGPAITARALAKEFSGGIKALASVDFSVNPGEIFAYLGRNGSGKTTTVRILTTLASPTSGTASVAGYDVVRAPHEVRRRIGATMQEIGLDPVMTGREHLRLSAGLWGLARDDRRKRALELLEFFGLVEHADRPIASYSGGMQRRLDLATAFITEPPILFLDEPTTGLDPQSRRALWSEIRRLRGNGTTVFLTTQYLEEAEALADHVAVLDSGSVVARGSVGELKAAYGATSVEFRLADPGSMDDLRRALNGHEVTPIEGDGVVVIKVPGQAAPSVLDIIARVRDKGLLLSGVAVREPTMEDVYVELTGTEITATGTAKES
jgi:ABC-2 type transport system ATP-binding protein